MADDNAQFQHLQASKTRRLHVMGATVSRTSTQGVAILSAAVDENLVMYDGTLITKETLHSILDRWKDLGSFVDGRWKMLLSVEQGKEKEWVAINLKVDGRLPIDMGHHPVAAVEKWNRVRGTWTEKNFVALREELQLWMQDPKNYRIEYSILNRQRHDLKELAEGCRSYHPPPGWVWVKKEKKLFLLPERCIGTTYTAYTGDVLMLDTTILWMVNYVIETLATEMPYPSATLSAYSAFYETLSDDDKVEYYTFDTINSGKLSLGYQAHLRVLSYCYRLLYSIVQRRASSVSPSAELSTGPSGDKDAPSASSALAINLDKLEKDSAAYKYVEVLVGSPAAKAVPHDISEILGLEVTTTLTEALEACAKSELVTDLKTILSRDSPGKMKAFRSKISFSRKGSRQGQE